MKNKILVSSILTIALCLSMIAGSTFALFTSESKVDIAVTSGKVVVSATVDGLETSSLGVAQPAGAFANGGTAVLNNGTLTLANVTPGDVASFKIIVKNDSNVSVKYRFTWSVAGELAPFLTATVDGNALTNNSTAWALWEGENTQEFAVVVELPQGAGNDAQGKTADIAFKVEAVQGNAVNETVVNAEQLQASIDLGLDNITLASNLTLDEETTIVIPEGKEVTLNLDGNTITGSTHKSVGPVVKNNGTLTIVGGTISSTAENGGSAVVNNGTLTVVDATLNGAPNAGNSWPSYAVNNTGVMTVNNCSITSVHGGLCSYGNGAVLTLNNSSLAMSGIDGFTSHGIYTYEGGQVIINGGNYANNNTTQNASGASCINGNVVINSGNFTGRLENYYGTPVIKGGTFSADPTRFLAAGYAAVSYNGGYMVARAGSTTVTEVSSPADVAGAITSNATVVLEDGEYTLPTLNGKSGVTIVGSEGTVVGGENATTAFGGNFGSDNTYQNLDFSGSSNGARWTYANGGTIVFDNCTFSGDVYGFHMDQSNGATLIFNNCTFEGFNAFAGDIENIEFNNCTFLHNGNYGHINVWNVAHFNNCTFGEGFTYWGGNALYFDGVLAE